jgi:uncharacterized cupredoxin-like copper-binding protein
MMKKTSLAFLLTTSLAGAALAHGDGHKAMHGPVVKEQKPWGIAGDAKSARRTIEIAMGDDMRFSPSHIEVREGETVRFVVRNRGKVLHEMVIGTEPELREHAALMAKFPKMEHDEPYMSLVKPGARETMVWNFNRPGEFQFACLVAGHFEAGMKGTISVKPKEKQ